MSIFLTCTWTEWIEMSLRMLRMLVPHLELEPLGQPVDLRKS